MAETQAAAAEVVRETELRERDLAAVATAVTGSAAAAGPAVVLAAAVDLPVGQAAGGVASHAGVAERPRIAEGGA